MAAAFCGRRQFDRAADFDQRAQRDGPWRDAAGLRLSTYGGALASALVFNRTTSSTTPWRAQPVGRRPIETGGQPGCGASRDGSALGAIDATIPAELPRPWVED